MFTGFCACMLVRTFLFSRINLPGHNIDLTDKQLTSMGVDIMAGTFQRATSSAFKRYGDPTSARHSIALHLASFLTDKLNPHQASYATTIIYVPMVFTVKLALLSVMLRIFAPDRKKVIIIYISLAILVCYYVPALFIKVFFCRPVSAYWLGTDNGGTCIDQQKVIIADSAISMISDLWILVLPIPMLWSLNMTVIKKLRVIGMLGAGGLATAFSIWRLQIMVDEGHSVDLTYFWIRAVLTAYVLPWMNSV